MRLIGFYNRSVYLTYFSVAVSTYGTFYALQRGYFPIALLCLMVCGLCDMFDGMIASKTKRSDDAKSFGIQIDSMCDLLNFGVFPAVIGYAVGARSFLAISCMFIFMLGAIIRLSFFNVDESKRQAQTTEKRSYYRGLPVTSVAMIIPIILMVNSIEKLRFRMDLLYPGLLLIIGILFVSDFRIPKPKGRALWIIAFCGLILFYVVWRFRNQIFTLPTEVIPEITSIPEVPNP